MVHTQDAEEVDLFVHGCCATVAFQIVILADRVECGDPIVLLSVVCQCHSTSSFKPGRLVGYVQMLPGLSLSVARTLS